MKRCSKCSRNLTKTAFGKDPARGDGLTTYCRECANALGRLIRLAERYKVLVRYSQDPPSCECCGETRLEFLAFDHVNGGGKKHLEEIGYNLHQWLKRNGYPDGFRVLYHNCNQALGHYGYCPHKTQTSLLDDLREYRAKFNGRGGPRRFIAPEKTEEIRRRLKNHERQRDIAEAVGVSITTVTKLNRRERLGIMHDYGKRSGK